MGGKSSKEDHESEEILKEIGRNMERHREAVYGIWNTIRVGEGIVEILRFNIKGFLQFSTATIEYSEHFKTDVFLKAEELLRHLQDLLLPQSNTLELTYRDLNSSFHKALDMIRPNVTKASRDNGTKEDQSYINQSQKCTDKLEAENNLLKTQNSELNEKLRKDVEALAAEIERRDKHISELESIKASLSSRLEVCEKEHKEQINTMQSTFNNLLKTQNSDLYEKIRKDVEALAAEFERRDKHISDLENTLSSRLEVCEKEHKEQINTMQSTLETARQEYSHLLNIYETAKRHVQVQFCHQGGGELLVQVFDRLKTDMADNMDIKRHKLKFIKCYNTDDVDPELPLLLLCMNLSRLGTDAATLLHKMKGLVARKTLLLIIHLKDAHALPSQTSDRVLTGKEFSSLGGIYDFGFQTEKGFYTCELNTESMSRLVSFLKKC